MYFNCEWDGPEHRHPTEAAVAACTAEFYAAAEREARRFDNAVPAEFFRDSGSAHLETWFSER